MMAFLLLRLLLFGAFLGLPGLALPPGTEAPPTDGSSSHSMRNFYTGVSEPDQGLPQLIVVKYVDDQPIEQYDSNRQRLLPKVPWAEEAARDVNQFWDTYTALLKNTEADFRRHLAILRDRYNQTGGFHSLQLMYGCELRKDGSKGGYWQYAYDGRDYISFDKETLTWTALDGPAQITKRKWEADSAVSYYRKAFLEEECIGWLKKYLKCGKEALLRTETLVGKVTCQAIGGGQEALICQAYGFYPREIEATWRKGDDILEHETFRRDIAPNSDGTYHIWLRIEIDSKERDLYRCHIDHASLPKPLVLAFEEPGVSKWLIAVAILGGIAVVAFGITFFFINTWQRQQQGQRKDPASSPFSSSSDAEAAIPLQPQQPPMSRRCS